MFSKNGQPIVGILIPFHRVAEQPFLVPHDEVARNAPLLRNLFGHRNSRGVDLEPIDEFVTKSVGVVVGVRRRMVIAVRAAVHPGFTTVAAEQGHRQCAATPRVRPAGRGCTRELSLRFPGGDFEPCSRACRAVPPRGTWSGWARCRGDKVVGSLRMAEPGKVIRSRQIPGAHPKQPTPSPRHSVDRESGSPPDGPGSWVSHRS